MRKNYNDKIHRREQQLDLPRFHCLRCHHTWIPSRARIPRRCPGRSCNSAFWSKEYTRLSLITEDALTRIRECPFTLCQERYRYLLDLLDLQDAPTEDTPDPIASDPPKYTDIESHEITRDNLPAAFKRIKH